MNASWYDRHLLPHLVDFACGMKPIRRQREKIAGGCHLDRDVPALMAEAGFR